MELIDSSDWLGNTRIPQEMVMRLMLWERDILSCQISLRDYRASQERQSKSRAVNVITGEIPLMLHYASNFVCAMRRVGRGLESLSKNRASFAKPVAEKISLVWRKKKAMFDSYTNPRNAIEHIDSELSGITKWEMLNLRGDKLYVTEDKAAEISDRNLEAAVAARNEIVLAILEYMPEDNDAG